MTLWSISSQFLKGAFRWYILCKLPHGATIFIQGTNPNMRTVYLNYFKGDMGPSSPLMFFYSFGNAKIFVGRKGETIFLPWFLSFTH